MRIGRSCFSKGKLIRSFRRGHSFGSLSFADEVDPPGRVDPSTEGAEERKSGREEEDRPRGRRNSGYQM